MSIKLSGTKQVRKWWKTVPQPQKDFYVQYYYGSETKVTTLIIKELFNYAGRPV